MRSGFCAVKKFSAIETDASGNCERILHRALAENCATILGASRGGTSRRSRTGRPPMSPRGLYHDDRAKKRMREKGKEGGEIKRKFRAVGPIERHDAARFDEFCNVRARTPSCKFFVQIHRLKFIRRVPP